MVDAKNLADIYGLPTLEWDRISAGLEGGLTQAPESGRPNRHTCWLATVNPDGSPHVTGVGALWVDGAFWFETGERTRKGRNLARGPRRAPPPAAPGVDPVRAGGAARGAAPPTGAGRARGAGGGGGGGRGGEGGGGP